jgi:hypothetical protein
MIIILSPKHTANIAWIVFGVQKEYPMHDKYIW